MAREDTVSTTALIGLQGQLDTVRSEIFTTNTNLQTIGRLVQTDTLEDQRRLSEQRERERLLLESKIRRGQEEELQQRLSTSLLPPVVKLEKKLNSTFENITKALGSLFGSFANITIQGFQTVARLGLGTLNGIGNLLKGFFGTIGSTLGLLSAGFVSVLSGIGGITGNVLKALGALVTSPFKAIADLVSKLLPGAGAAAAAGGAAAGGLSIMNIFGIGSRIATGTSAVQNLQQGNYAAAGIEALATVFPSPLPAMGLTGVKLAGGDLNNFISKTTSGFSGAIEDLKGFDITNPFSGENLEALKNAANNFGFNFNAPAQQAQVPVQSGSTATTQPSQFSIPVIPYTGDIQPPNKPPAPSPTPEAKPDLIYLNNGQTQQAGAVSGNIQTLTDVPLIPSANPDNFYAVYAQINYNVVL